MRKAMVFIDFENFNIALINYYRRLGQPVPKLDYNELPLRIVGMLPGHELVKTFLFAPKPDDFLMQDPRRKSTYDWISGLKNQKYFTVIEGQHVARNVYGKEKDITDRSSYYVVEKGTDINMGAHMITKAFLNAYDTAIVISGDTDYVPVLNILNTIGKVTVVVRVCDQYLGKIRRAADDMLVLDDTFFSSCLRAPVNKDEDDAPGLVDKTEESEVKLGAETAGPESEAQESPEAN